MNIEDIAPNLARVTLQTIVFDGGLLEYRHSFVGNKDPTKVVVVKIKITVFVNIYINNIYFSIQYFALKQA